MNTGKRKIFIVILVAITFLVVGYIVYMFLGNKGTTPTNTADTKVFNFGALIARKKTGVDGSKIGNNADTVNIGINTSDASLPDGATRLPDGRILLANGVILNPDGTPINPNDGYIGTLPTDTLVPLPDPNIILPDPNIILPDPNIILPDPNTNPSTKNSPCGTNTYSKEVLNIICGNPGFEANEQKPNKFSLTDEEQAELDRLGRAFARIAPYLKTEADVAQEKSNEEAYRATISENTKLAEKTRLEILSPNYKGPLELKPPFLTKMEFKVKITDGMLLELFGYTNGRLVPFTFDILTFFGIEFGPGGDLIKTTGKVISWGKEKIQKVTGDAETTAADASDQLVNTVGALISSKVIEALLEFIASSFEDTVGSVGDCADEYVKIKKEELVINKVSEACGFSLFEKTLNIY